MYVIEGKPEVRPEEQFDEAMVADDLQGDRCSRLREINRPIGGMFNQLEPRQPLHHIGGRGRRNPQPLSQVGRAYARGTPSPAQCVDGLEVILHRPGQHGGIVVMKRPPHSSQKATISPVTYMTSNPRTKPARLCRVAKLFSVSAAAAINL